MQSFSASGPCFSLQAGHKLCVCVSLSLSLSLSLYIVSILQCAGACMCA